MLDGVNGQDICDLPCHICTSEKKTGQKKSMDDDYKLLCGLKPQ